MKKWTVRTILLALALAALSFKMCVSYFQRKNFGLEARVGVQHPQSSTTTTSEVVVGGGQDAPRHSSSRNPTSIAPAAAQGDAQLRPIQSVAQAKPRRATTDKGRLRAQMNKSLVVKHGKLGQAHAIGSEAGHAHVMDWIGSASRRNTSTLVRAATTIGKSDSAIWNARVMKSIGSASRNASTLTQDATIDKNEPTTPTPTISSSTFTSPVPTTPSSSTTTSKIAVVFKTIDLVDECRRQRVLRLAELTRETSMHVWVLYDGNASSLAPLQAQFSCLFGGKVARSEDGQSGRTNAAFVRWLASSTYDFAWYLEDDVEFTGSWTTFFKPAEEKAGQDDIVATFVNVGQNWWWARGCWVLGRKCFLHDAGEQSSNLTIVQTYMAIFRMSRRFASAYLRLERRKHFTGFYEAVTAPLCDRMPTFNCTRSQMHFPGGVYTLGGAPDGPFWHGRKKHDEVFSLTALASYKGNGEFDWNKYRTNADVPQNCLFHPVKCEAELARRYRERWK